MIKKPTAIAVGFLLFFHILQFAEQRAQKAVIPGASGIDQHGQQIADIKLLAFQNTRSQLFAVGVRRTIELNQFLLCRRQAFCACRRALRSICRSCFGRC